MDDDFLKYPPVGRLKGVEKIVKKNSQKIIIILMLAVSIFFCAFSEKRAIAGNLVEKNSAKVSVDEKSVKLEELGSLNLILGDNKSETHCEDKSQDIKKITTSPNNPEEKNIQEPKKLEKIEITLDAGVLGELASADSILKNKEENQPPGKKKKREKTKSPREQKILSLVANYPIEEMLPFLAERQEEVASYLVAIAKKESDWGKHSPKKDGKNCYNYWGYRGTYNQTDSGYSCFDSAEQAIKSVGDRIEELLNKKINTPEKFIVWKCGSTCAGHDPGSVLKWISDVKLYYQKMNI